MQLRKLNDRRRLPMLVLAMVGVAAVVTGIGVWAHYQTTIDEQHLWLRRLVQSRAHMIEAVARFDAVYSRQDHPQGAWGATMSQLADAQKTASRFGKTGEFAYAVREGDMIVYLFEQRNGAVPEPIPFFGSKLAEPMRHALMGHSGTLIGLDRHGNTVLAAYEPIAELNIGLVAKIDLAEVRAPFIRTATLAGFGALLIIAWGGWVTHRIGAPLVQHLQATAAGLENAQRIARLGSWDWDIQTGALYWSDEMYRIFGVNPKEFKAGYGTFINLVHPDDRAMVDKAVNRSIKERTGYSVEYRIVLPDNAVRAVHAQGAVTFDDNDKPQRMIGTVIDITERKSAEELIKASLAEKEVLLQEIHHRVKNNLQVVSSLLSLQADAETDGKIVEALQEGGRRVSAMARVHETLYRSADLTHVNAGEYLGMIIEDIRTSHVGDPRGISLHDEIEEISFAIDQAIPVGQIVSELVSNIFKHAFPGDRSGAAEVSLKRENGGRIELVVADDGIGLPEDSDPARTPTLGLRLVTALTQKLGGTIDVDRSAGTRFRIVFAQGAKE